MDNSDEDGGEVKIRIEKVVSLDYFGGRTGFNYDIEKSPSSHLQIPNPTNTVNVPQKSHLRPHAHNTNTNTTQQNRRSIKFCLTSNSMRPPPSAAHDSQRSRPKTAKSNRTSTVRASIATFRKSLFFLSSSPKHPTASSSSESTRPIRPPSVLEIPESIPMDGPYPSLALHRSGTASSSSALSNSSGSRKVALAMLGDGEIPLLGIDFDFDFGMDSGGLRDNGKKESESDKGAGGLGRSKSAPSAPVAPLTPLPTRSKTTVARSATTSIAKANVAKSSTYHHFVTNRENERQRANRFPSMPTTAIKQSSSSHKQFDSIHGTKYSTFSMREKRKDTDQTGFIDNKGCNTTSVVQAAIPERITTRKPVPVHFVPVPPTPRSHPSSTSTSQSHTRTGPLSNTNSNLERMQVHRQPSSYNSSSFVVISRPQSITQTLGKDGAMSKGVVSRDRNDISVPAGEVEGGSGTRIGVGARRTTTNTDTDTNANISTSTYGEEKRNVLFLDRAGSSYPFPSTPGLSIAAKVTTKLPSSTPQIWLSDPDNAHTDLMILSESPVGDDSAPSPLSSASAVVEKSKGKDYF